MPGDNVTTSDGKIASDEINTLNGEPQSGTKPQVQRVKIGVGPDGKHDDIDLGNPMPVEIYGLLSELIKAVDALRVVDQAQRQRITLDAISAALTLASVTTVATVSQVSNISAGTLTNLIANAGMDREQYINIAAQAYALAIRPQLQFS